MVEKYKSAKAMAKHEKAESPKKEKKEMKAGHKDVITNFKGGKKVAVKKATGVNPSIKGKTAKFAKGKKTVSK